MLGSGRLANICDGRGAESMLMPSRLLSNVKNGAAPLETRASIIVQEPCWRPCCEQNNRSWSHPVRERLAGQSEREAQE